MKQFVGSLAFLLVLFGMPLPAATLHLYTEEYPPVSFSRAGEADGMASELVRELLRRAGHQATIDVVPWTRGYWIAQHTPGTGLFVTMRTAEREQLFKWVGPILVAVDSFYALQGSGIRIDQPDDLGRFGQIAAPRDWFSYQILKAEGRYPLVGVTEPEQMFKMLRRGRVKLIVADNLSFLSRGETAAKVDYLTAKDVEVVHPFMRTYGYITFPPSTDDRLIRQLQDALDGMREDGAFSAIYQRWLPGEPEPPKREFSGGTD